MASDEEEEEYDDTANMLDLPQLPPPPQVNLMSLPPPPQVGLTSLPPPPDIPSRGRPPPPQIPSISDAHSKLLLPTDLKCIFIFSLGYTFKYIS